MYKSLPPWCHSDHHHDNHRHHRHLHHHHHQTQLHCFTTLLHKKPSQCWPPRFTDCCFGTQVLHQHVKVLAYLPGPNKHEIHSQCRWRQLLGKILIATVHKFLVLRGKPIDLYWSAWISGYLHPPELGIGSTRKTLKQKQRINADSFDLAEVQKLLNFDVLKEKDGWNIKNIPAPSHGWSCLMAHP